MPPPETFHRHQKAVLWPATGYDRYGQPTLGAPDEILVRWETRRTEALDPQGNTIALDATVATDQDITIGSLMWLGELEDWYGTGSAGDDTELMVVKTFDRVPDIKNIHIRRVAGLMKYKNTVPEGSSQANP